MMATEYKPQITLGNLIQIGVTVFAVGAGYATLDGRITKNGESIDTNKTIISAQDTRLRDLETSRARFDERFTNILALLSRIDAKLERIEQRTQP